MAVTRENVPEETLYFLQHRWRFCDYVRTPLGSLTWGNAARFSEFTPIVGTGSSAEAWLSK